MGSPRYTVILRGEHRFTLSRSQIERDSPENYFACCFLKDFTEAESRTVELDQDPALFALIVQHLSGYRIIPLSHNSLPPGMSQELAMENLLRDAKFFGLDGLYRQLTSPALPPHINEWNDCGINGQVIDFEDVIYGRLPPDVLYTKDGLCRKSSVNGTTCPVLVYGRNMPLEIHWEWIRRTPDGPEDESGFVHTFYLRLLPCHAQSLRKRHEAWLKALPAGKDTDRIKAEAACHPDASIRIDGRKALCSNIPLWLNCACFSPEKRNQRARYEEIRVFDESFPGTMVSFDFPYMVEPSGRLHLWADGVFFLINIRPNYRDWVEADPTVYLTLLDVRARTRGAVMDAAFPPLSSDKGLEYFW